MQKIIHVSGTRKKAIARATLKTGKGIIRINKNLLQNYNYELQKDKIMEPLQLAGDLAKNINISVNVFGGGINSQAEAIRLAIAKGLVEFTQNKNLKQVFLDYDRRLLVADVRRNEPHKPNNSKPRKKRQKSYR
jgi:small subunit ribosomal protein S9